MSVSFALQKLKNNGSTHQKLLEVPQQLVCNPSNNTNCAKIKE